MNKNETVEADKSYYDYCIENIEMIDNTCELYINKLLYYRYILNSGFNKKEIMGGVISNNINDIVNEVNKIIDTDFIKNISEYLDSTDVKLNWSDFKDGELNKKILRDYKLFRLIE